ncbi:phosphoribosylglycinamide formyltransferase [Knoellia locipacati]|uniref:Phosphoribosylglycinamide formyltransferase n=1 Tax=Knoellia locipacati TaxID=882824 RepID=A0A512SWY0_9MICO|nr:phosphoribosylglycinamide formyltransferase [Knoellia locipacati]
MTEPAGIVVLVSGSGTLLQALLDASLDPAYGVRVVAVGADRDDIEGLRRAERAGVETFVCRVRDFADRGAWDEALAGEIASRAPDFVVTAGFMKILGPATLAERTILNTHPALLPSFPGAHAVRDALAHGVKVTGTTAHLVDAGVDTGPILAQRAVEIRADDTEDSLHERIKVEERELLVDLVGRLGRDELPLPGR